MTLSESEIRVAGSRGFRVAGITRLRPSRSAEDHLTKAPHPEYGLVEPQVKNDIARERAFASGRDKPTWPMVNQAEAKLSVRVGPVKPEAWADLVADVAFVKVVAHHVNNDRARSILVYSLVRPCEILA